MDVSYDIVYDVLEAVMMILKCLPKHRVYVRSTLTIGSIIVMAILFLK